MVEEISTKERMTEVADFSIKPKVCLSCVLNMFSPTAHICA
jgi:hypothetical protein